MKLLLCKQSDIMQIRVILWIEAIILSYLVLVKSLVHFYVACSISLGHNFSIYQISPTTTELVRHFGFFFFSFPLHPDLISTSPATTTARQPHLRHPFLLLTKENTNSQNDQDPVQYVIFFYSLEHPKLREIAPPRHYRIDHSHDTYNTCDPVISSFSIPIEVRIP